MRIGIDVDGVLADTIVAIHRKFNGWDTTKGWYGGFTKEEFDKVWADARHTRKFWESIPVVQGFNHRAMIDLNLKHDLYFITDRFDTVGGSAVRQTLNWVRFQLLAEMDTIHTPAGVVVAKAKGPVAKALDLDAFIDDKPENCIDVAAAVPTCSVTLCSLPHNLKWESPANITRRESFNAFAMHILSEE